MLVGMDKSIVTKWRTTVLMCILKMSPMVPSIMVVRVELNKLHF